MSEAQETPPKQQDIALEDEAIEESGIATATTSKSKPQPITQVVIDDQHPFAIEAQEARFKCMFSTQN